MINLRNITLTFLSGLVFFAGNAFAQDEAGANCEKGPRGPRGGGETAGVANAQEQGQRARGGGLGPAETATRMMSNFDQDGDGALNMQELTNGLAALQESMRQMQMQRGQQSQGGQQGAQQGGNQAGGRRGSGNQNQAQSSRQRGQRDAAGQGMRGGGPGGQQRGGGGGQRRGR